MMKKSFIPFKVFVLFSCIALFFALSTGYAGNVQAARYDDAQRKASDVRPAGCSAGPIEIFILNTGDIHEAPAHLEKIRSYVNKKRQENPGRVILLDAGDMLTHFKRVKKESSWQGQHDNMYNWAASMYYDAMVFGNHDFVDTVAMTMNLMDKYKLPFVCANLEHPALKAHKIHRSKTIHLNVKDACGAMSLKVGVIGLADEDRKGRDSKGEDSDYHDRDKADRKALKAHRINNDYTKNLIAKLEEKSDFVIILSHNDDHLDEQFIAELPRNNKHIVVGGHSHKKIDKSIHGTSLVKSGCYGQYVGRTIVTWDPAARKITKIDPGNHKIQ